MFLKDVLSDIYWNKIRQVTLIHYLSCSLLWLSFYCPNSILFCSFQEKSHLYQSQTLPVPWKFKRISEMLLHKILSSLGSYFWPSSLYLYFFENFWMILNVRILAIFKKKLMQLWKNICILVVKDFLFKNIESWLVYVRWSKTFLWLFLGVVSHLSLSFRTPMTRLLGMEMTPIGPMFHL